MAKVVVTMKIMPESPEVDLGSIEGAAKDKITAFAGAGEMKVEHEPIAFGLKALKMTFVMAEDKGDVEGLEKDIATVEGVRSVETTDVRRALG